MYTLKALKLKTDQEVLAFWCTVFIPLIIKAALPLRAIGDEQFRDGVAKGVELVVTNISGKGTFDPKKGNVIEWFKKAIAGVRMEARKDAEASTQSLDALIERQDESEDESFLPLADFDGDDQLAELDDFSLEFGNWILANTTDGRLTVGVGEDGETILEPANPDEEDIQHGDTEGGTIVYKLPEETVCPVYFTHESRYGRDEAGQMVELSCVLKCVQAMPKRGAAAYGGDEHDEQEDMAWRTFIDPQTEELDTDYEADFRHDPDDENDFAAFMESYEGEFSREALVGLHQWMKDDQEVRFISPYMPVKRKAGEPVELVLPDAELGVPDEEQAEAILNPFQAPTVEQMAKAMQVFEQNAEAIKHLAYLQWKGQPEITVKSLDVANGGFIKANGKFVSMAVAAGIAAAIKPVNGNQLKMAELVLKSFPTDTNALKFVQRVEAVVNLPL